MKNLPLSVFAIVGGILTAAPASAQRGNSSDVTGPNTTSSAIAGGFAPSPGTAAVPVTAALQAAVVAMTQAISSQITNGTLTTVTGASVPAAVQAEIGAVLFASNSVTASGAPASPAATTLAASLTTAGAHSAAVKALVESLAGLISNPAPGQLTAAVSGYNQVVETASAAFLANPPAEFLAIQSVLAQLAAAGGGLK